MASHAAARTATQGGPDPDRQALWPGAGSRCGSGSTAGSRLRGSASENRHGGAPREVPVAPGQGGRASQARPKVKSAPVGAPSTPHRGDGIAVVATAAGAKASRGLAGGREERRHVRRDASKTRAQQRAAGTNNTALFDIVNRDYGQRFAARAATSRASLSCPGRATARPGAQGWTETRRVRLTLSRTSCAGSRASRSASRSALARDTRASATSRHGCTGIRCRHARQPSNPCRILSSGSLRPMKTRRLSRFSPAFHGRW